MWLTLLASHVAWLASPPAPFYFSRQTPRVHAHMDSWRALRKSPWRMDSWRAPNKFSDVFIWAASFLSD